MLLCGRLIGLTAVGLARLPIEHYRRFNFHLFRSFNQTDMDPHYRPNFLNLKATLI